MGKKQSKANVVRLNLSCAFFTYFNEVENKTRINFWDSSSLDLIFELQCNQKIQALALSNNNELILIPADSTNIQFISMYSGEEIKVFPAVKSLPQNSQPTSSVISHVLQIKNYLIVHFPARILIYELTLAKCVSTITCETFTMKQVLNVGNTQILTSSNEYITLYDLPYGNIAFQLKCSGAKDICIISSSIIAFRKFNTVHFYNVLNSKELNSIELVKTPISKMVFNVHAQHLIIMTLQREFKIWSLKINDDLLNSCDEIRFELLKEIKNTIFLNNEQAIDKIVLLDKRTLLVCDKSGTFHTWDYMDNCIIKSKRHMRVKEFYMYEQASFPRRGIQQLLSRQLENKQCCDVKIEFQNEEEN